MGFTQGEFPPVAPATFQDVPYRERNRILNLHWVDYGFGAPKVTMVIYLVKLLVLYAAVGTVLVTVTSGYSPFEPSVWWDQPIIWQKVVAWTMLLETIGIAGSWGPLAGHFKPMTGGILYWARPGTIRLPPWQNRVPLTRGDNRTPFDVALYLGLVLGLVLCVLLPGADEPGIGEGLMSPAVVVPTLVLLVVLGLRDKIVFVAARSEQWAPALAFFAFFPYVDMIVAGKILIVCIWVGAAFSKVGRHFANVIPVMVSNTPWLPFKKVKRMHYRDWPEDLRPSKWGVRLAHIGGTFIEAGMPVVLLFSHSDTITAIAAIAMIGFRAFIISTFPMAVPLEWNLAFMFITGFLFFGHPNNEGFGLGDMDGGLMILTFVAALFFPILGNNRPDLVSFLPSMRQYSGNWATAMWAFAPGAEDKLDQHVKKPAMMQKQQLTDVYGEREAEVVLSQLLAFRSMHSQARGLNSVMMNALVDDIDYYTLREAEFSCNALIGFNFGDGHLHKETLIEALQRRCNFEPGEFIVVWVESEAAFRGYQVYWVMDAAVGIVERGTWDVTEATREQPHLPNGPISINVTWRKDGYERKHYPKPTRRPDDAPAAGAQFPRDRT